MAVNRSLQAALLNIKESLTMALLAVRTNKLRSILTLLGIAVGVFSIIGVMTAMGALVNGIEEGMSELGANTFQVQKFPVFHSGDPRERAKLRNRKNLTFEQGEAVRENATLARAVGIESWQFGIIVKSSIGLQTNPNVSIAGENVEGFITNNWSVNEGRVFSQDELNNARRVAVIGMGVSEKIFPRTDPIGKDIRIDGIEYQVIGIIERRGQMLGGNQDNYVAVPISAYFQQYGKESPVNIMVQSTGPENFEDCIEQVRGILRTARLLPPGAEDDFYIFSNDSVIAQFNEFTKYVRLGITLISMIALIAAGVGIMNIMLVSVTERTREIGIRKAIGARKNNILSQFMLEAVILSELGGLIGITLGVLGGNVVAIFMEAPPVIPVDWVIIGFVACSIVGIVFGVYPAWKASNLDPIESLRYE